MISPCYQQPSKVSKSLGLSQIWKTAEERGYTLKSVIGSGSYGVVVKAQSADKKKVAIKLLGVDTKHKYELVKVIRRLLRERA